MEQLNIELHFVIVALLILIIVCLQIAVYRKTRRKIEDYTSIFPSSKNPYGVVCTKIKEQNEDSNLDSQPTASDDNGETADNATRKKVSIVHTINVATKHPTMKMVVDGINKYLCRNKGSANDFYLMKDIVERYCDADEEEINVQQPIPLYLGLMGTMIGIIVGIGSIALDGGLTGDDIMNNISPLMTCVAIAMVASLVGILCTTLISWKSKNATTSVEAAKNSFYSWLQTEFIPRLSTDTSSELHLLSQNLTLFNQTFQNNIEGLDRSLGRVQDTSQDQVELMRMIQDIDVKNVAEANVKVLRELEKNTPALAQFNSYINSTTSYLKAVTSLNEQINVHLDRTKAIEDMGTFFKDEIKQIEARKKYINQTVADVDNTLRNAVNELKESTHQQIKILQDNSIKEIDLVETTLREQRDSFATTISSYFEGLEGKFDRLVENLDTATKEVKDLGVTKKSIKSLVAAMEDQNSRVDRLISSIEASGLGSTGTVKGKKTNSTFLVVEIILLLVILVLASNILM